MALLPEQQQFLEKAMAAAVAAGVPWPGARVAEACLESRWGSSQSVRHNNLLGLKVPSWWNGPTFPMPTDEFLPSGHTTPTTWRNPRNPRAVVQHGIIGTLLTIDEDWCEFASWEGCFWWQPIIQRRAGCYAAALAATTPDGYLQAEGGQYSTGPGRAQLALAIFHGHSDVLQPVMELAKADVPAAPGEPVAVPASAKDEA